jgi:hypothetical protein
MAKSKRPLNQENNQAPQPTDFGVNIMSLLPHLVIFGITKYLECKKLRKKILAFHRIF